MDRLVMILGSIVGLVLIPAAGIALFPEGEGPLQGRSSSTPEDDDGHRSGGLPSADPAPARTGAQGGDTAQEARAGPDPMSHDTRVFDEAVALGTSSSGSGFSPRSHAGRGEGFDHSHGPRHVRMHDVDVPAPMRLIDPPRGLPDWWPTLATVSHVGADKDTWGVGASFLIVSRDQDHIVETGDGTLHMVINRGLKNGLTLISSHDDGATWTVDDSFGADSFGTNRFATADIRLIEGQDVMILSYLDANNDIAFAMYDYDTMKGSWTLLRQTIVDDDPTGTNTLQSTVAMTPDGTILLAYTEETEAGGLRIMLHQSCDNGRTWTESVLDQPKIDSGTARTIAVGDQEGIIYSNAEAMYWLTWDAHGKWDMELIDPAGTVGRFHSHFSTITAGNDVVVVNIGTDLTLRILRFDGETGTWDAPAQPLKPGLEVTSAQISISDDTGYIYVTYDDPDNLGRLFVIESKDGGETWNLEAVLQTPLSIVAEPTRFEAPEHFSGDLVVTQQVMNPDTPNVNGLYYQVVDVDGPETPIPADIVFGQTDAFLF